MDATVRLKELQEKVTTFNNKKIGAEKELELLRKQHADLIEELKQYGVEDVKNLPDLITRLEKGLKEKLDNAEIQVKTIEEQITQIG